MEKTERMSVKEGIIVIACLCILVGISGAIMSNPFTIDENITMVVREVKLLSPDKAIFVIEQRPLGKRPIEIYGKSEEFMLGDTVSFQLKKTKKNEFRTTIN